MILSTLILLSLRAVAAGLPGKTPSPTRQVLLFPTFALMGLL